MAQDAGKNIIGCHIWVKNLENGLIYAAIADIDSEGIVAIWSFDRSFREADYGKKWVAMPVTPFATGKECDGWGFTDDIFENGRE